MYWKSSLLKLARRRRAALAAKAGYSLLEILIVLAIIALIAALVGPRLFAQLDHAKVTTARVQTRSLESALQTMELDIGRYPTESEGLNLLVTGDRKSVAGWNGPYLSGNLPNDPWGHAYVYDPPADAAHGPKVHSLGSDGKPGGTDNAADIYSDAATPVSATAPTQAPAANATP
ncbi:MAG TPA: type II secretion system major pseudopilin GspG [Caulobacteraceae bacterium]|jgi:general secretion pathway protein G|nr:type II secretion system major pseudopilin GspG [Caulobacteraceae bacterium]